MQAHRESGEVFLRGALPRRDDMVAYWTKLEAGRNSRNTRITFGCVASLMIWQTRRINSLLFIVGS